MTEIELRWLEKVQKGRDPERVLQFRTFTERRPEYREFSIRYVADWTEWKDVPTEQWKL